LKQTIDVEVAQLGHPGLARHSLLKEFAKHPKGKAFHLQLVEAFGFGNPYEQTEDVSTLTPEEAADKKKADMAVRAFLDDMPVYKVCRFSEGRFTEERLEDILKQVQ
jgi:beta-glucosidase